MLMRRPALIHVHPACVHGERTARHPAWPAGRLTACPTWVKDILKEVPGGVERSRVEWEVLMTAEVEAFLDELYESDPVSHQLVNQAILVLERNGPAEGRPLVDTITASRIANMKELRPPSAGRSEVRILLVFDPWRSVILLVAGDKSGQWDRWYRTAIPTLRSSMTTTWPSGARRWAYEQRVALAGFWPPGARRGNRRRPGGLRYGRRRDAG
jgi:hypothetical protein